MISAYDISMKLDSPISGRDDALGISPAQILNITAAVSSVVRPRLTYRRRTCDEVTTPSVETTNKNDTFSSRSPVLYVGANIPSTHNVVIIRVGMISTQM